MTAWDDLRRSYVDELDEGELDLWSKTTQDQTSLELIARQHAAGPSTLAYLLKEGNEKVRQMAAERVGEISDADFTWWLESETDPAVLWSAVQAPWNPTRLEALAESTNLAALAMVALRPEPTGLSSRSDLSGRIVTRLIEAGTALEDQADKQEEKDRYYTAVVSLLASGPVLAHTNYEACARIVHAHADTSDLIEISRHNLQAASWLLARTRNPQAVGETSTEPPTDLDRLPSASEEQVNILLSQYHELMASTGEWDELIWTAIGTNPNLSIEFLAGKCAQAAIETYSLSYMIHGCALRMSQADNLARTIDLVLATEDDGRYDLANSILTLAAEHAKEAQDLENIQDIIEAHPSLLRYLCSTDLQNTSIGKSHPQKIRLKILRAGGYPVGPASKLLMQSLEDLAQKYGQTSAQAVAAMLDKLDTSIEQGLELAKYTAGVQVTSTQGRPRRKGISR